MQDLNKRIEMVKAKELLGIPLNSNNSNCRDTQVNESKTEYAATAATKADLNINIALLKEIKRLEKEYAIEIKKIKKEHKASINHLQKQLETATNEKATNLQIRKIVDKMPGAHYQLDEKISILEQAVDLANIIYKGRFGLENDTSAEGTNAVAVVVKGCEGRYNLGSVVSVFKNIIDKFSF